MIPRQRLFDFYPRWAGARAVLAGENPYSREMDWKIQEAMLGRRQSEGEAYQVFAYPATITWLLLPFWLLPFPLAVSLWCGLQLVLLLLSLPAVMGLLNWNLRPLPLAVLLFFSVFAFRYPMNAYVLGQFIPLVLAGILAAWWGTANHDRRLTILGLAAMLVRPEVAVVPFGALLLHNWVERKRVVVVAAAGLIAFLWLLTRIWIGPWELDFLRGIVAYPEYSFISWLPTDVGNIWLGSFLALCVLAWGGWMWWSVRALPGPERLPWEISASLLAGLLVMPQPNTYTLILALIPVWVALWASPGRPLDWLVVLVLLSSPWAFFLLRDTLPFAIERSLIPFAALAALTLGWRRRLRQ